MNSAAVQIFVIIEDDMVSVYGYDQVVVDSV